MRRMGTWKTWLAAGVALGTIGTARAGAADASAGVDLNSAYIWRGITFNGTPVAQPWLDVSGIKLGEGVSLGANVWTNVDLGDWDGKLKSGEVSEVDLTLTLTLPKGFKAGYIEYTFPAGIGGSRELFAGWSGTKVVTLSANAFYDLDEGEDYFGTLGVGKAFTLSPKASLSLDAQAGFAGEDFAKTYGGSEGGLYHYNLAAKLSYKATDKLTLGASLGYTGAFDEAKLPEQDASVYGGVSLSLGL